MCVFVYIHIYILNYLVAKKLYVGLDKKNKGSLWESVCASVCVCVSERASEEAREREGERARERESE